MLNGSSLAAGFGEAVAQMLGVAQGYGADGASGIDRATGWQHAAVHDVQIRHVPALTPLIHDRVLTFIAHPASAK